MEVGIESVIIFDVTTREVESIPADEPVWSFGWSPDGHIIGLVSQTGLAIYDVEAGVVRPIRGLDGQDTTTPYWLLASPPVFTADSSAILYTDGASATTGGDIWLVSMAQPESQPLLLGGANDVAPVAARDGHRFVYGRSSAATIERAFTEKGGVMRDGSERASDLFLVEGPTASPTAVAWDVWPRASWSPDGRWLVTKSFDRELVFIDLERPERPLRVPLLEHVGGFSWGPQPP
jgi:Tol biopolymer transport system component